MEFQVATKQGEYDLQARVVSVGRDLLVLIWGGQEPHIGAVAMAQPRPSLKDPERRSATASVFCYLGHKEDELAKEVAETLAASFGSRVVVTAGAHWDDLSEQGIARVLQNSRILLDMLVRRIRAELASPVSMSEGSGEGSQA